MLTMIPGSLSGGYEPVPTQDIHFTQKGMDFAQVTRFPFCKFCRFSKAQQYTSANAHFFKMVWLLFFFLFSSLAFFGLMHGC
jgi:hypothetical protein